jgi:hypothetical protein
LLRALLWVRHWLRLVVWQWDRLLPAKMLSEELRLLLLLRTFLEHAEPLLPVQRLQR